jgi:hypothetical protein
MDAKYRNILWSLVRFSVLFLFYFLASFSLWAPRRGVAGCQIFCGFTVVAGSILGTVFFVFLASFSQWAPAASVKPRAAVGV